jgi:hypothetical protein
LQSRCKIEAELVDFNDEDKSSKFGDQRHT